jgi:4-hydroxybenzoate polyprenyltransferase
VRISRPDQVLLILAVLSCGAVAGAELSTGGGHAETTEMTAIGAVVTLVAVSVHAANEFADVETDARTVRTRFSGGSGALATYGLGASFALRLAVATGLMAVAGAIAGVAVGLWSETVTVLLLGAWSAAGSTRWHRSLCLATAAVRSPMRCLVGCCCL